MMIELTKRLLVAAIVTAVMGALQPQLHVQLNSAGPKPEQSGEGSWMISGYDLAQNNELAAIEHHLEMTDTTVTETNKNLGLIEREISEMQGANRVWFWLLGGLITAIGVTFWKTGAINIGSKGDQK
jgi:hypothetical protein